MARSLRVWVWLLLTTFSLSFGVPATAGLPPSCEGPCSAFLRGDANDDGGVSIADGVTILSALFGNPAVPFAAPLDAGDANDDGSVNIGDAIYVLSYLFSNGPEPAAPFPLVGFDPTPDALNPGCDLAPIDLSYGAFLPAVPSTNTELETEIAIEVRDTVPDVMPAHDMALALFESRVATSSVSILLEQVHGESAVYGFYLLSVDLETNQLHVASNIPADPFASGIAGNSVFDEPGLIQEKTIPMDPTTEALLATICSSPATSGLGGDDLVDGGEVTFLTYRNNSTGSTLQHVLYGFGWLQTLFEVLPEDVPTDPDDFDRYAQMQAVLDLWEASSFMVPSPITQVWTEPGVLTGGGGGGPASGLVLRGNEAFKEEALGALMAISPCYLYELVDCQVLLQTPIDTVQFCECYCDHLAGTNLICDLALSTQLTTIRRTFGGNSHRAGSVRFNPKRMRGGEDCDGNRERPPKIGLAHELIHAKHWHCGTHAGAAVTGGIRDEEINTVRGENQIRAECGQVQRKKYGDRNVPMPGMENIDGSDRIGCNCD